MTKKSLPKRPQWTYQASRVVDGGYVHLFLRFVRCNWLDADEQATRAREHGDIDDLDYFAAIATAAQEKTGNAFYLHDQYRSGFCLRWQANPDESKWYGVRVDHAEISEMAVKGLAKVVKAKVCGDVSPQDAINALRAIPASYHQHGAHFPDREPYGFILDAMQSR